LRTHRARRRRGQLFSRAFAPLKAQDAPPQNNNPLKTTTPSKQIFIGNFEYEAQERDIVRLFERYGPVEKIDMKSGEWWWACWL
jgi:RNA recognition motif-containing protein